MLIFQLFGGFIWHRQKAVGRKIELGMHAMQSREQWELEKKREQTV